MHVPTLPTKSAWETPIAASREIVGAITEAADTAVDAVVDTATSALRSARRHPSARRRVLAQWRWIVAGLAVIAIAAAVARRRGSSGEAATSPSSQASPGADARADGRTSVPDEQGPLVDAGSSARRGTPAD